MKVRRDTHFLGGRGFTLDVVTYQITTPYPIPSAYASLRAKADENGNEVDAVIVAGSVGTQYTRSDGQVPDVVGIWIA